MGLEIFSQFSIYIYIGLFIFLSVVGFILSNCTCQHPTRAAEPVFRHYLKEIGDRVTFINLKLYTNFQFSTIGNKNLYIYIYISIEDFLTLHVGFYFSIQMIRWLLKLFHVIKKNHHHQHAWHAFLSLTANKSMQALKSSIF